MMNCAQCFKHTFIYLLSSSSPRHSRSVRTDSLTLADAHFDELIFIFIYLWGRARHHRIWWISHSTIAERSMWCAYLILFGVHHLISLAYVCTTHPERGIFIVLFECHRQHSSCARGFYFEFLKLKNVIFVWRSAADEAAMEFPYKAARCWLLVIASSEEKRGERISIEKYVFIRRCCAAVDDDVVEYVKRPKPYGSNGVENGDRLLNIINESQCIIGWSERRIQQKICSAIYTHRRARSRTLSSIDERVKVGWKYIVFEKSCTSQRSCLLIHQPVNLYMDLAQSCVIHGFGMRASVVWIGLSTDDRERENCQEMMRRRTDDNDSNNDDDGERNKKFKWDVVRVDKVISDFNGWRDGEKWR